MRTRSILALLTAVLISGTASAQTLPDDARAILERVATIETTAVGDLPALAADARTVADRHPRYRAILPGDGAAGLQAALDAGPADIRLCAGCEFTAGFYITRPVSLTGDAGARPLLHGVGRPAITVWPGVRDVLIESIRATSTHQTVILLGHNDDSQTTLDLVPERIILRDVHVPTHRGKRGIEVNATNFTIEQCSVLDVRSTAGADSQAIAVLNTPGHGTVRNCVLVAASENILVGGDTIKIPGVIPAFLVFEDLDLTKPREWADAGVPVKNLFELKTCNECVLRRSRLAGSWSSGQGGWALVLTPRSGGAVTNFLAEDLTLSDVAGVANITGHDLPQLLPTPTLTTGLVFRRIHARAAKTVYGRSGGRGIFAMLTMGLGSLTIEDSEFTGDGNHLIYGADSEPIGDVRVTNTLATVGQYGISFAGAANLTNLSTVGQLEVVSNTFAGAVSTLRTRIPLNTFVTREQLDAAIAQRGQ